MKLLTTIENFFTQKVKKQNNLYNIFKKYIDVSHKLQILNKELKSVELEKLENQLNEYFIPVSDLYSILNVDEVKQEALLKKVKHISELNTKDFSFIDLHASYVDEGILLTSTPKTNSEPITIVSFIQK